MSTTEYLLNAALIALVILQVRGRRFGPRLLLLPLVIVAVAAAEYLRAIPTAHNDLFVVLIGLAAGAVLGTACGLTTSVFSKPDGSIWAKAGVVAAVLWVLGVGSRVAFALYVTHGGEKALGQFSAAHGITSAAAWVDGLVLMALAEVLSRTAVLALRYLRVHRETGQAALFGSIIGARDRSI